MKHWPLSLLLLFALALPTVALEDEDPAKPAPAQEAATAEKDKAADTDEKKDEAKLSPIPKLAELRIDEYTVAARMVNIPLPGRTRTVQELLDQLEQWSKDEQVGAVLLDLGEAGLTLPDVEEMRAAVERVRKCGKKVWAFVNAGGPESYLLACAADGIAVPPIGSVAIPGIGRVFPFMKGHYQMQGMEFDVITAGKFKYPGFTNRRGPDQYFCEEFGAILDSWFDDYKSIIAKGRNLPPEEVAKLVDIGIFRAEDALQRGLVDKVVYYEDYREQLLSRYKMKRLGTDESGLLRVNSIQDLVELINRGLKEAEEARRAVGPKIAVLHARGPIIDQSMGSAMSSQVISRDDFVKVVDQLRKNDSIKAVVMRVDSPGGSAYASDVIWQHLAKLNEEKPLVVSMGSVAGSGGYYIACGARKIIAQPTTITGSIGVLGILSCAWSQLNRADIEMYEMARGAHSLLGSSHTEMRAEDRQFIQDLINDTYDIFIARVAAGRRIPEDQVRKLAEGRIYTGRDALELGLVDAVGGLNDAIQVARELANIPPSAELKIVHYPRPSSLGEIFESFSMVSMQDVMRAYQWASSPAQPLTFDDELRLFSQRLQPLAWTAMPAFYRPDWQESLIRMPEVTPTPQEFDWRP